MEVADNDFSDNDLTEVGIEEYLTENPNMHHVTPHERVLSDGRTIWVDGDGDTTVDTSDGWFQGNPNYRIVTKRG